MITSVTVGTFYLADLSCCLIFGFGIVNLKIVGATTFDNVWVLDRAQTYAMSDSPTDPDFGIILNLKNFMGMLTIGGLDPFQPN